MVLAILGLVLWIVALRGPRGNAALDLRGTAGAVSDLLRLARSQAIAGNRSVGVVFDPAGHTMGLEGGPPRFLSGAVSVAVTATADNLAGSRAAIRFAPDGSASGGRVVLAEGGRQVQVGVDWLTGRVTVGP